MITLSLLTAMFPNTKSTTLAALIAPLNEVFVKCGINTKNEIAAFLAQVGHESAGFSVMSENLNYGDTGLRNTFRKYFPTPAIAKQYARQPEKIANRVYSSRMGNGNEASGDGWRYRGGGYIQLTGKDNYQKFAEFMGMSLADAVAFVRTPRGACMSAGWYWTVNKLNAIAETGDMTTLTKRINGGTIGLAERSANFIKAKRLLG